MRVDDFTTVRIGQKCRCDGHLPNIVTESRGKNTNGQETIAIIHVQNGSQKRSKETESGGVRHELAGGLPEGGGSKDKLARGE
jgi:hypothetical protein